MLKISLYVHMKHEAERKNICFENEHFINLTNNTIVHQVQEIDNIPQHVFNFTEFTNLQQLAQQNRYLTGTHRSQTN